MCSQKIFSTRPSISLTTEVDSEEEGEYNEVMESVDSECEEMMMMMKHKV